MITHSLAIPTNTDDATTYADLGKNYHHESVNHYAGEYVKEQAHTNRIVFGDLKANA